MKTNLCLSLLAVCFLTAGVSFAADASPKPEPPLDATYRLIYYSVLEGAFEDGLGNADVDRILLPGPDGKGFQHFIYACPLCMPTINALQTYRQRAPIFGYKIHGNQAAENTYGPGLSAGQKVQLRDPNQSVRLGVINQLVRLWIERRLASQRLTPEERKSVQAQLEDGRKRGMEMLTRFKADNSHGVFAPGFEKQDECAVCNGAVGMGFKVKP